MIRAFVAVFPPLEVSEALFEAAQRLQESRGFRLVSPQKIHLTLKFLGDIAEYDLDAVKRALEPVQHAHDPFEVITSGFGAFPSETNARILWAGIEEGSEHLRRVAERVEELLEPAGYKRENRPYVPHLTLGRARARRTTLGTPETPQPPLKFTVSGVDLVESAPGKRGITYSVLEAYPFEST